MESQDGIGSFTEVEIVMFVIQADVLEIDRYIKWLDHIPVLRWSDFLRFVIDLEFMRRNLMKVVINVWFFSM